MGTEPNAVAAAIVTRGAGNEHCTAITAPPAAKPIVLLACGSFSPITTMHLRNLENTRDTLRSLGYVTRHAYLSPVSSTYAKPGLLSAAHRVRMCELAVAHLDWVSVDTWESAQDRWSPSYIVARRLEKRWGCEIAFVCGGDVVAAMSDVARWPTVNVVRLLECVLLCVVERGGLGVGDGRGVLEGARTVRVVGWSCCLSSSEVRECVKAGLSIRYMVPDAVVDYIAENGLFLK